MTWNPKECRKDLETNSWKRINSCNMRYEAGENGMEIRVLDNRKNKEKKGFDLNWAEGS
jgi:hypothetical protein